MITDAEIQKIFDWADANKVVGKRWKKQKWGINLVDDEIDSVKKGIPRDRDTLLKITHLNLSKSKLLDIPVELYKLIKLQKLDISNNNITTLSKDIGNLVNLEYLDLSQNYSWSEKSGYSFFSIPIELKNLKKLRYLNLFDIKLKTIPKEIWELRNLEILTLGFHDTAIHIPKEIGSLINLIDLDFRNLSNVELPFEIGNLSKLENLKLSACAKLERIPEEIGNLKNLVELKLEYLNIKTIPKEIENLLKLENLKLSGCKKLERIPEEIGNLKNLVELELEYLNIETIPKEIGNLSKLENLKLSDCEELEIIPSEIGKLQKLKDLDISWNKSLKELPKEVGNLISLTNLNFSNSDLEKLPSELSRLKNLKILNDEPYIILNNFEEKKEIIDIEKPMEVQSLLSTFEKGNLTFPHKNLLLKGVPGTGKSKTIDNIIENDLDMNTIRDNVLRINIHSASSNSDLMQGISISTDDKSNILYQEKRGAVLKHIFKAMFKPKQPFVLVLEEIQENSLNELIGDLIYLIEKDKRTEIKLEDEQELSYEELFEKVKPQHFVELPNLVEGSDSNIKMIMPDNLYVFCTSNYRDDKKVIEDNLLRRFDVVEIYPQTQEQLGQNKEGNYIFKSKEVSNFLSSLNELIEKQFKDETHPDRYLVGHANWLNITDEESEDNIKLFYTALLKVLVEFKEIREVDFKTYVKPILEELFKDEKNLYPIVKKYLDTCEFEYKSYKEMVSILQVKIYDFL